MPFKKQVLDEKLKGRIRYHYPFWSGECRQCGKHLRLFDEVVSHTYSNSHKPKYYCLECAELLALIE